MPIKGIQILPPFAIGRFGASETPLEAYRLEVPKENPLDYRKIIGEKTFVIDSESGAIVKCYTPNGDDIWFKDAEKIRPVAPFLELYADLGTGELAPLTLDVLSAEGYAPSDIYWSINVANLKVFRQTYKGNDKITGDVAPFNDHVARQVSGVCENFRDGKFIHFGYVRYIKPTADYPGIRLRFTPGHGLVYGASKIIPGTKDKIDPVFEGHPERIVYDSEKGSWLNFQVDVNSNTNPNPSDIYQGTATATAAPAIGWGYIDDVCDGPVTASLKLKDGTMLSARAWVSSCMPAFAPDSEPMRTVADDLEQLILGHEIADEEISLDAAAEIVRRALETIRFINTRAMNANVIEGRSNIGSTLYRQDSNDYGRNFAPGMASSIVDNLAVRALHERIYAAICGGSAPWFAAVLRRPEEIGDLSDEVRRKMPPMLRGADGRALTLTRRQISKIVKAAAKGLF